MRHCDQAHAGQASLNSGEELVPGRAGWWMHPQYFASVIDSATRPRTTTRPSFALSWSASAATNANGPHVEAGCNALIQGLLLRETWDLDSPVIP